jgi:dienelactone hydrolase
MRKVIFTASAVALVAAALGARGWAGDEPPSAGKGRAGRMETRVIEYKDGDVVCRGYLAHDPTLNSLRPVVLVVGDWFGLGDFAKKTAERMVEWGYAGFAVDMYGEGKLASGPEEAGKLAGQFRGDKREVGRKRARAALEAIGSLPQLDTNKVAALGFCFGGTVSLELAWSGAPIKAAISFHGHPTAPGESDTWTADLLVLHGGDDPFVPAQMLTDFQAAVRKQKNDYEIDIFSGALHSFTDPSVDARNMKGAKYDARAATRAFERAQRFLAEAFGR